MSRFLIRRVWGEADDVMMFENGRRSRQVREEAFPDIVWEHSHVAVDSEGRVVSFCIYQAPSLERVMAHGELLGGHVIDEVIEIGGDIKPEDFPLGPQHDHVT